MAIPERTLNHCHWSSSISGKTGGGVPTGAHHSARAVPSASGNTTKLVEAASVFDQTRLASPPWLITASPVKPSSVNSSLASLSLALARITNIDKRFRVAGRISRLQTIKISSGLRLNTTKLACMRPFGLQNAASRASDKPSNATSCVSWPCRKLAASSPMTRITPMCVSATCPDGVIEVVDGVEVCIPELS